MTPDSIWGKIYVLLKKLIMGIFFRNNSSRRNTNNGNSMRNINIIKTKKEGEKEIEI